MYAASTKRNDRPGTRRLAVALGLAVAACAGAVWAGTASVCAAQSSEPSNDEGVERTAAARTLFEEGMRAVDARNWALAADQLGRSLALRSSVVVRFNLALALVELGRFVEASEHLRAVQREAPEDALVRVLAAERLGQVLARIGRLRIDVSGPLEGREVRLDDAPVPDALLGAAQPADPGVHRVRAVQRSDQTELAFEEVRVESGALARVSLSLPALPEPPALVAGGIHPAAVATLIVAGGLFGSFGLFATLSELEDQELAGSCGRDAGAMCDPSRVASLGTFNLVADVSWIAGAAAAAVGIALWLVLPPERGSSIALVPWVSPEGAGGGVVGRW
jgi:hypothetical protein